MIDRLRSGVAAGALAGLAYGLFTWVVVSPLIHHLEHLASHGGDHAHDAAPAVSETATAVVSAGGGVLWGVLLGAAFGVAYHLFEPALPGGTLKPYVLAGAGFLTVSVAPWTVLPPATPGMEPLYGSSLRVPLYLGLVGIGGLVAATSVLGYARASRTRGRGTGAFVALLPLVALGILSIAAPPTLTGGAAPAGVSAAFRWLVGFSQAGLWALIAVAFSRFDRRVGRPDANSPTPTARGID
ncbi:cobalamin cluster protein [Halorubrum salipaludis]|uniref:Cobalamin cluster protein n=1 Tax=Halorubrum salipaludis TaxID=2032630 RepID=A0A2A2FIV1_9EURY|nr:MULTISPECIES: CbtA family protein [Halorubrum]PAU84684.1 cobalamin cluster protein [Halorubrum salipaludis]